MSDVYSSLLRPIEDPSRGVTSIHQQAPDYLTELPYNIGMSGVIPKSLQGGDQGSEDDTAIELAITEEILSIARENIETLIRSIKEDENLNDLVPDLIGKIWNIGYTPKDFFSLDTRTGGNTGELRPEDIREQMRSDSNNAQKHLKALFTFRNEEGESYSLINDDEAELLSSFIFISPETLVEIYASYLVIKELDLENVVEVAYIVDFQFDSRSGETFFNLIGFGFANKQPREDIGKLQIPFPPNRVLPYVLTGMVPGQQFSSEEGYEFIGDPYFLTESIAYSITHPDLWIPFFQGLSYTDLRSANPDFNTADYNPTNISEIEYFRLDEGHILAIANINFNYTGPGDFTNLSIQEIFPDLNTELLDKVQELLNDYNSQFISYHPDTKTGYITLPIIISTIELAKYSQLNGLQISVIEDIVEGEKLTSTLQENTQAINNQFPWGTALLSSLLIAAGSLGAGYKLYQLKRKTIDRLKLYDLIKPEFHSGIEYLNRVVGITHGPPTKKGKETGVDAISRLTRYQEARNKVSLTEARSLIQLAIGLEENPELLKVINHKRRKVNIDHVIRKHAENQQVLHGDIQGHFELSDLQSEQVFELLSVIGDRIDSEDLNELSVFLKYTRNAISRIESEESELKVKLSTLALSIEQKIKNLNTNSQNQPNRPEQEKPVETITINGEEVVLDKKGIKIGDINIPKGAIKEVSETLQAIRRDFNGQPETFFNPNNNSRANAFIHGRAYQVPDTSLLPSEELTFIYDNPGKCKFKVTYRLDTDDFLFTQYDDLEVQNPKPPEQVKKTTVSARGESPFIPEEISDDIVKRINGDLRIPIQKDFLNYTEIVRAVQHNLVVLMNEQPDLFEVFYTETGKKPSGIKLERFQNSIARAMIKAATGELPMMGSTTDAFVDEAEKMLKEAGEILDGYKGHIGKLRMHLARVLVTNELGEEHIIFRIAISPNDHNSAR